MSKFQYWLGWVAAVGSVGAVLLITGLTFHEGWSSVGIKIILMPFVFLWGIRQIRAYNIYKNGVSGK
jgi:hypothetical protein